MVVQRPKTQPKIQILDSRNTQRTLRSHELVRKVRANFGLLPWETSQEPTRTCSENLVQMSCFILGRFLGGVVFHFLIPALGPKNHDSQRRDRILRFFLRLDRVQFSPYFGAISLLNYTKSPGEKGQHHWRKIKKNPVETALRNFRFCPLSWSNVS